jgi:hypothetical protein
MALLPSNRIAWMYTDENNVQWRVAAVKAYTDQAKLGGAAWDGVAEPKPANLKMRRITVRNAANGLSRVVPVYSAGAPIQTKGATVNLNANNTDSYAFESDGNTIPQGHIRESVTRQST